MEHKTVLIADDDTNLVQMLSIRFKQFGIQVFRSPDAMHALLGIHRMKPNLVILDVNMPGGNGVSVCEMLANDKELSNVPVIVMTGQTDDAIRQRCRTLGAHYVAKGTHFWETLQPLAMELLNEEHVPSNWSQSSLETESIRETSPDTASIATTEEVSELSDPEPIQSDEPSESGQECKRPKVLCIDDDPDITKILKRRLERYGIDVLRAFNGMQGYWTALDMRPDVIITDMVMPDGEGNYLFWRLKCHSLTEKTPILVLSGQTNPAIRRQMLSAGADAFLTKPINFDKLMAELRQFITISQPETSAV
jgi:DNA-binding response OmpR family regulator